MTQRKQIMRNCPEEFEEELKGFLDEIEFEVNNARSCLDDIKSVNDLERVSECRRALHELGLALY